MRPPNKGKIGYSSLVAKAKCFIRLRRFYHPRIDQSEVTATGNVVMGYGRRAASLLVPASPRYPSTIDSKLLLTKFSAPTRLFLLNRDFSRILRSSTTFGRLFFFLNAPERPGVPSSLSSQPPSIRLFSPISVRHGVAASPFRRDNSGHEEGFQTENLRYANLAALVVLGDWQLTMSTQQSPTQIQKSKAIVIADTNSKRKHALPVKDNWFLIMVQVRTGRFVVLTNPSHPIF
jgi:hypothetical protein